MEAQPSRAALLLVATAPVTGLLRWRAIRRGLAVIVSLNERAQPDAIVGGAIMLSSKLLKLLSSCSVLLHNSNTNMGAVIGRRGGAQRFECDRDREKSELRAAKHPGREAVRGELWQEARGSEGGRSPAMLQKTYDAFLGNSLPPANTHAVREVVRKSCFFVSRNPTDASAARCISHRE
jgi:hypothetical protein